MTNSTRCTLLAKQACTTLSHVVQKITPPSANNFLKYFFTLFAAFSLSIGNAWGEEVEMSSFSATAADMDNYISYTTAKGGGTSNPTVNDEQIRLYQGSPGGNITVSAKEGVTITEVTIGSAMKTAIRWEIDGTTDANNTSLSADGKATKSGISTKSITCHCYGSDKNSRLYVNYLKVVYTIDAGESPGEGGGEDPTPDDGDDEEGVTYELVTSTSKLEAGAKYIVGNSASISSIFMSTATNTNNRKVTSAITIIDNKVTITEDVLILELGGETGAWTFKTTNYTGAQGFLTSAASGNNNYCKVVATAENCSYFTVAFNNQEATITSTGRNERNILRYNSSSSLFACYSSGQSPVYLYKLTTPAGDGGETPEPETPATELTDAQFAWSAATATALKGADNNEFPTLTNDLGLTVTYDSSNKDAATIAADGSITLVAPGTTIISAAFAGGEVSETNYAAKTVSYTLTVKKAPLAPIAGGVIDILNQAWTGKTNSTYGDVAVKTAENEGHSNAQYVAQCAGDKSSIQLRSNNNNSGVVSTISGGIVKRVEVEWQNETTAGRILQVYGSNTAYEAATDLYSDDKKGELLGEITMGGEETVVDYSQWTGDYKYIGLRSKSGAMYLTTITITWLPINSKVTIDDAIQNGSISVSGAADLNAVAAGTVLTLSNTPATGYKLAAYDVYKSDDATTKVTVTDGKFIMPEFDVTISATFELAKTLTGIEITTPATQTTFWQGETFNHNGLKVTAHFDGAADEDVTDKVTVTGSTATAGAAIEVTVSYNEGATTKTATYNITVKDIPNTKETAYSVADAFDIIDKLGETEGIYITGTISQVDSYSSTYKSITYWISADGTTTNQLQVYGGKGLDNADFASKLDLTVGDQVIVVGKLKKYNSTYEFDANNYLASHTPTTKDPADLAYATTEYTANVGEAFATPELTNPYGLPITYSTSDASKATVDANTGAVTIKAAGVVTITAATTGDATHDAGSASYNITITDPSLAVAQLPFTYNSGKADIETTAGITQEGLDTDYSTAPKLKFDGTGDNIVIRFDSQADELSYDIKGNPGQGTFSGTFAVQESEDGSTYTDLVTYTTLETTTTNKTHKLAPASRYVKFVFTEKSNGNVGLGNINITKLDDTSETPEPIPGYNPVANPTTLSGVFSVAADKKVQFSTGNLQYEVGTTNTTNTWSFASEQYEVIGGEAYTGSNNTNYGMNVPNYTGKLDLFAWSCDGKYGVNPSNTDSDYQGTFVDWGTLAGEGWFTLTKEEMNYILNRTKNGKKLWALATIDDLPGLILLPDNWNTNITLNYGYIPTQFVYNENLFTAAEWEILEVAGAVFLPAAGSRTGGYGNKDNAGFKESYDANGDYFHVDNVGIYGYYWLNTQDPRPNFKHCASYLILPGWDEGPTVDEEGLDDLSTHPQVWSREKRRGNSVRLVKIVEDNPTITVPGCWELVTDASTLAIGDKVVIAAKDYNYALSTTQNNNNRGQAAITKDDNTISFSEDVQILTLQKGSSDNTFTLYTGTGYLYAASSSSNHLKTQDGPSINANWTITINNNITNIIAQGDHTHNWIQYNKSSNLFSCYSSGQQAICLYRKKNVKVESNQKTTNDIPNYSDVTVGSTGQLNVEKPLIVENLYIQTTMGAATSAQISNATNTNLLINGDVFIDITLGKNGDPNQWHAFTVPFPVDAMNGVYDLNDNKLTNEVNYAIMDYHGDLRANGQYGWKKYRGILVPGTFYLMTVDGARTTYRFKKVEDAAIVAPATKAITAYTGTGDETKDKGWNGVGNPTLMHGKVGYKALILNPESYTYEPIPENTAYFTVGTPFFIQAATDGTMTITAEPSASLAPARRAAAAVENIKVMLGNSDYTDYLYVSASEDAINEYEIGKDLGKMAMTNTPRVVQISALAYDTRLCMIDAPMANNEALVALNLYAPANGEYTLSIEAQDNEKVYLLHEGTFVWDLSMSEYPITLNKGDNTGYSILVRRADAPTSVETIDGANNQTEKLIHNGNLYILHNGKVFDAVGTMLK